MSEFLRFCIVGAITFIIDYGLLYFLTEYIKLTYLVSSGVSFSVAVMVNYVLCLTYVFKVGKNGFKQIIIFITTSVIGLILNQLCMWLFVEKLSLYYMMAKIGATGIVMIWNFITKKKALEV